MSNEMKVFENEQFGQVRVLFENDEPKFVAKDAAIILGYKEPAKAVREHVDEEDRGVSKMDTPGGIQNVVVINESGLYSLILSSKLPSAKAFKRWVTHEVLPSIRKHGVYATDEVLERFMSDPRSIAKIFTELADERDKNKALQATVETQAKKIEADKPKVRYYDIILQCEELLTPTQIAKDYGMSAIKFNRLLNEQHIQFRQGKKWILYQKYADLGWGQNQTSEYYTDWGFNCDTALRYTQVGRRGIYDKLKASGILPICER